MKQNKKIRSTVILFTLVLPSLVFTSACSSSKNVGDCGGPQGGPPPETITACEGKSVGDAVSFKGRRGEMLEATCKEIDGQLAAAPEGAPPRSKNGGGGGPQGGPPPEAITACEGKSSGDTISFKGRRGETLEATCKEIDGQLVAAPEGPPPRK